LQCNIARSAQSIDREEDARPFETGDLYQTIHGSDVSVPQNAQQNFLGSDSIVVSSGHHDVLLIQIQNIKNTKAPELIERGGVASIFSSGAFAKVYPDGVVGSSTVVNRPKSFVSSNQSGILEHSS
jgi:hypothetical protein